jgi:hypothetical protein
MKITKHGTVTKYSLDDRETPWLRVAQGETFQVGLIADRLFLAN